MKSRQFIIIVLLSSTISLYPESLINIKESSYAVDVSVETGFISVLNHTIQIGEDGTDFDYITQGGQDILFPINRFDIGLTLSNHRISFLYQPLEIETTVQFQEDVVVDGTTFSDSPAMDLTYSFPFWRVTYLYDVLKKDDMTLGLGAALQLRNASISFDAQSGENLTVSQNLGPVPALSLYFEKLFNNGLSLSFDATGSYATSAFINGADFEFEGSLLDSSLKIGFDLKNNSRWYLLARYLGGSAEGNSEYVDGTWTESSSSYTSNYLSTITIGTGLMLF